MKALFGFAGASLSLRTYQPTAFFVWRACSFAKGFTKGTAFAFLSRFSMLQIKP